MGSRREKEYSLGSHFSQRCRSRKRKSRMVLAWPRSSGKIIRRISQARVSSQDEGASRALGADTKFFFPLTAAIFYRRLGAAGPGSTCLGCHGLRNAEIGRAS